MHNERTNLLSPERQRALARDYFLRLGVVIVAFLITLTFISAVLLVPTYVYLAKSVSAKEARLATIESAFSSASEKELSARLAALSSDVAILTTLSDAPSVSKIMSAVFAVSRPGITLSSFTYTPAKGKTSGTLIVSGTAMTRDALRNYQLALQGAPFALSATLPVSAYAEDTYIAFTITVTLAS
jgi:hypothetical protein